MNNAPVISVIMSVYNSERFLREAIESILMQTFTDFELIIIDDGSTDNSSDIIKSYNDPRIITITNEKNIGLTESLNKGIKQARGKYIARIDSDDVSLSHRFETQIAYLEQHPNVALVGSSTITIDEKGHKQGVKHALTDPLEIKYTMLFDNQCVHPTIMMRTEVLKGLGGYDEQYVTAQDYALYLRILETHDLGNIAEPLLRFRLTPSSVTQTPHTRSSQNKLVFKLLFSNTQRYVVLSREAYSRFYFHGLRKDIRSLCDLIYALKIHRVITQAFINHERLSHKQIRTLNRHIRFKRRLMIKWYLLNKMKRQS